MQLSFNVIEKQHMSAKKNTYPDTKTKNCKNKTAKPKLQKCNMPLPTQALGEPIRVGVGPAEWRRAEDGVHERAPHHVCQHVSVGG